jgi:hypothetical protein
MICHEPMAVGNWPEQFTALTAIVLRPDDCQAYSLSLTRSATGALGVVG